MQLKFNDARFCLDERFADDTNDMDIDNADRAQASEIKPGRNMSAENVSLDEDDLQQEKKSNMAILESVLGRTLKHSKSSSKKYVVFLFLHKSILKSFVIVSLTFLSFSCSLSLSWIWN